MQKTEHSQLKFKFKHNEKILHMVWGVDGKTITSISIDKNIRIWDTNSGEMLKSVYKRFNCKPPIAFSPDGRRYSTISSKDTVLIWGDLDYDHPSPLQGAFGRINCISWSPDSRFLASGASDRSIRIWDTSDRILRLTLNHQSSNPLLISWSPFKQLIASAASDNLIYIWDSDFGSLRSKFVGHTAPVSCIAWSPDGEMLVTGSDDKTVHIWDSTNGKLKRVLEGHTSGLKAVSFTPDSQILVTKANNCDVKFWCSKTWRILKTIEKDSPFKTDFRSLACNPKFPLLADSTDNDTAIQIYDIDHTKLLSERSGKKTTHYVNAKVVIIGEGQIGKTTLGYRLVKNDYCEVMRSHGANVWQLEVPDGFAKIEGVPNLHGEITLWDFAGQPDYRIVHHLFLDDTDVALLLFDCSNPGNPFYGVDYWANALNEHTSIDTVKYLLASRCDICPIAANENEIEKIMEERGLDYYFRISSMTGENINMFYNHLLEHIPWDKLPRTSTPDLFDFIRQYLLDVKKKDAIFISSEEIFSIINNQFRSKEGLRDKIYAVIDLLQARGLVYRSKLNPEVSLVLLKPECINQYASSIVQAARINPRGDGTVLERDIANANIPFNNFTRLKPSDEKIVLQLTAELLIKCGLCIREMGLLIFPSQVNTSKPKQNGIRPQVTIKYRLSGAIETIYATLIVRLSYTDYFRLRSQWKYSAEFICDEKVLGIEMKQIKEGRCEIIIYSYRGVREFDRNLFLYFVNQHIKARGIDIEEEVHQIYCPSCGIEVTDRAKMSLRIKKGFLDIICENCRTSIIIPSSLEKHFLSDKYFDFNEVISETADQRLWRESEEYKENHGIDFIKPKSTEIVHILHISDIHMGASNKPDRDYLQLVTDLERELEVSYLDYIIISGDIGYHSNREEYNAAFELIDKLVKRYKLNPNRIIVVPGNHDLNWELSKEAFSSISDTNLLEQISGDRCIPDETGGKLMRDEELYKLRFSYFSEYFYKRIYGCEYPADYDKQAVICLNEEDKHLFLNMNSSWNIDHFYTKRANVKIDAVTHALTQLLDKKYDNWLKIAVVHHPCNLMDDDFLELLAVNGFNILLHGHIHKAQKKDFYYDDRRGIHMIGAGTIGAPVKSQEPGIPLQYNFLKIDQKKRMITVETRKRELINGAWSADARWMDKKNPKPRYFVYLKDKDKSTNKNNGKKRAV